MFENSLFDVDKRTDTYYDNKQLVNTLAMMKSSSLILLPKRASGWCELV